MVLLVALMPCSVPVDAQEDRDAILLRRELIMTPAEMLGLDITPEAKVALDIDARGRVAAVEVTAITPSTEHDDVLREHLREALMRWRFAPALEAEAPVASRTELLVQVRPFATPQEVAEQASRDFFLSDPLRRQADLMRSSFETRKKHIDDYLQTALRGLDPEQLHRADSPRFLAFSQGGDADVAEGLVGNLEVVYNTFQQELGGALEGQPERYKIVAFLFSQRSAYLYAQSSLRNTTLGSGFYLAPGFLAFHREFVDPAEILAVMIHEAFHAYSDRKLRRPGTAPLLWLEEGLAQYFGNSTVEKGQLVPGKTLRRKFLMHYGQVFKRQTNAGLTLKELRSNLKSGKAPKTEHLLALSHLEYYGPAVDQNYGTSWLLVHFLRHGEPGWIEKQFPELLLYLYEGYPATEALAQVYGLTPEEIDERLDDYVSKL